MGSLIDNTNHISSTIKEMPDERLTPFLELAGFGSTALIRTFDLQYDLIFALVERWRPETHTFHLPCRECTITLEDVAVQFGLPIDGNAVTSVSSISRPATLFYELLGRSPSEGKFASLRLSWLKANFEYLPSTANEREVMQAVRAYIMHLIGGLGVRSVSHVVSRTLSDDRSFYDGHRRMPHTAAVMEHKSGYRKVIHDSDIPSDDRESFWRGVHLDAVFCSRNYGGYSLVCPRPFKLMIVEWYHGDRVLRQFGCIQYILSPPVRLGDIHGMSRRGRHGLDWVDEHDEYVTMWNNQFERVPQMDRGLDLQPSLQYLQWYCKIGKPFLFGGWSMVVPPHTTRIGQHLSDPHHALELEPQQEPKPELHFGGSSYHPDLGGDNYFLGSLGHRYHSEFDIFSPLPPQYSNHPGSYLSQYFTPSGPHPPMYSTPPEPYPPPYSTPLGPYPPPYSTPLGSSSSMAFETYDILSMFHTPPHTDEENVDRRSHPQRERWAPQKYTPRTTPSNHQF
ncbi:hypothetical protein CXB51_016843 [Gossypium anomalum]|uniref:Aminotransferase-like plant mobile domain-containing protein n=1 Tax=Gossypium anomalum TaxID=47600 RepID=A0A8J5YX26_9ROSI|nr:hypothetical protein CXB51_016843 [Gossypium anomalum]